MASKVTIYSTSYCPHCRRAKNLLEARGIAYEEVDLSNNDKLRAELTQKTGQQTVPMIFIGDEFIGGSDALHDLEQSGKLDQKLSS